MTREVTPRAVTKAVGWIPKTGCNTESRQNAHTSARVMLMKMLALGTSLASSRRRRSLVSTCAMAAATTTATANVTARTSRSSAVRPKITVLLSVSSMCSSSWLLGLWYLARCLARKAARRCDKSSGRKYVTGRVVVAKM